MMRGISWIDPITPLQGFSGIFCFKSGYARSSGILRLQRGEYQPIVFQPQIYLLVLW